MQSEQPSRGWQALPPPLVFGICLSLLWSFASGLEARSVAGVPMSAANLRGLNVAIGVLLMYGVWELSRRHRGTTRAGLRLLVATFAASMVMAVAWHVLVLARVSMPGAHVLQLVSLGVALAGAVAVGMAMSSSGAVASIGLPLILVVAYLIPWLMTSLSTRGDVRATLALASSFSGLVRAGVITYVVVQLAGEAPPPVAPQIASALRDAGRALTICAALLVPTLLCVAGLASYLMIAASWLGTLAVIWLGVSLLRAARTPCAEPASNLLCLAAVLLLVCGGGMVYFAVSQVVLGAFGQRPTELVVLGVLLGPGGSVVLAAAIARYATRAGFNALRLRATWVAIGIVAAAGVVFAAAEQANTLDLAPLMILGGLVAVAELALAWLCRQAARSLASTSDRLPVARVV